MSNKTVNPFFMTGTSPFSAINPFFTPEVQAHVLNIDTEAPSPDKEKADPAAKESQK